MYEDKMNLNSLYIYILIFLAVPTASYYILKALEAKRNIHILPYTMRKLFIGELKDASNIAYDLFSKKLLKNDTRDDVAIFLIGNILFVLIILDTTLVPHGSLFNYYFFIYFSDFLVLAFLLLTLLIWTARIFGLRRVRRQLLPMKMEGNIKNLLFDENKNERKMIRLYHYIENFRFISALAIFGLFIQSIFVQSTPFFYFQTNLAIALLPLGAFGILVLIIFLIGRIRITELNDVENYFLMELVSLPETHKTLLLKTSENGMFPDTPQICYLEEIGSKLKISYEWKNAWFVSYVKWKNVAAFGFKDVKLNNTTEKTLREKKNDSDSKSDI